MHDQSVISLQMHKLDERTAMVKSNERASVDSFHRAIGPVLRTAQIFGLLPVSGTFAQNVRDVQFRWKRCNVLMAGLVIAGASLETSLSVYRGITVGMSMGSAAGIIFLGSILLGSILMLRMAQRWPELIRLWQRTEDVFLRQPYRSAGRSLKWRLRLVGFTVMFIALIEHILYITSVSYSTYKHLEVCSLHTNFFEALFRAERSHIFAIIPYSPYLIAPLEFLNVSMTFCWSFVDVFIMVISIGLSTRFTQIGDRLQGARGKIMPESFWIEMRSHYLIMTELLQYVDQRMSILILLSCANNLFFICYQLFNSFNDIPYIVNSVYFWLSLGFIIGRTLATLFCAASVHDASMRPLAVLRNVPSMAWTIEVQRFTDQILTDVVALSGKRFFFLTRKLILAMAGTVATYELVLLDELEQTPHKTNVCD